jgi:hypothetical protein
VRMDSMTTGIQAEANRQNAFQSTDTRKDQHEDRPD